MRCRRDVIQLLFGADVISVEGSASGSTTSTGQYAEAAVLFCQTSGGRKFVIATKRREPYPKYISFRPHGNNLDREHRGQQASLKQRGRSHGSLLICPVEPTKNSRGPTIAKEPTYSMQRLLRGIEHR